MSGRVAPGGDRRVDARTSLVSSAVSAEMIDIVSLVAGFSKWVGGRARLLPWIRCQIYAEQMEHLTNLG